MYCKNWFRCRICGENGGVKIFCLYLKERYSKKGLIDKLELEIKKNEIVDFHGKNFEKLKNEIINEIEKEYENEKELNEDFEKWRKVSLESELKTKKSKSISDLQELIEKTDIKIWK